MGPGAIHSTRSSAGERVFFVTSQQLVVADGDLTADIYLRTGVS